MFVLENFKNIPRSPYGGRQGSNVIFFFFKFATKSLEEKKRGPVAPPTGDRLPLSYFNPWPPFAAISFVI